MSISIGRTDRQDIILGDRDSNGTVAFSLATAKWILPRLQALIEEIAREQELLAAQALAVLRANHQQHGDSRLSKSEALRLAGIDSSLLPDDFDARWELEKFDASARVMTSIVDNALATAKAKEQP